MKTLALLVEIPVGFEVSVQLVAAGFEPEAV